MKILLIIISILIWIYGFSYYKNNRNPLAIFGATWTLALSIHTFSDIKFDNLNIITIINILLLFVGYIIGCTMILPKNRDSQYFISDSDLADVKVYAKIIRVFSIIGLISIVIYIISNPIEINFKDDFERLDYSMQDGNAKTREFIYKIGIPFLVSSCLFSSSIRGRIQKCTTNPGNSKKIKDISSNLLNTSILCIASLIAYDVISLKRMQTINVAACILTGYIIINENKINFFKIAKYAAISLITIYIVYTISEQRDISSKGSILNSWGLYFAGPISFFDSTIKKNIINGNYYGLTSLMGFLGFNGSPIMVMLDLPFGFPYYFERQNVLSIGESIDFNAFGSIMLDGYYDGKEIGVFLLAIFAGFTTTWAHKKSLKNSSPINVCLSAISITWVIFFPIAWTGGMQLAFGQSPYALLILAAINYYIKKNDSRKI